jgi:hypothetical protein
MYEHITTASFPGLPNANKIGATQAIAADAGTAIHLTASVIRKAMHQDKPAPPNPPQET